MTATIGEIATLAHGYTMADVERCAAWACRRRYTGYLDPDEKWDVAWFGILELLYESNERPDRRALQFAAEHAISEAARMVRQGRGHRQDRGEPGPNFIKYWHFMEAPVDGFTDRIVERLALPQILGLLTDKEYEAIAAQAMYFDGDLAAASLRITRATFHARLKRARTKLIAAWFDHETPVKKPWADPLICRHGHPRATYGFRDKRGLLNCRKCRVSFTRSQRRKEPPSERVPVELLAATAAGDVDHPVHDLGKLSEHPG